jgi:hypothetical protein
MSCDFSEAVALNRSALLLADDAKLLRQLATGTTYLLLSVGSYLVSLYLVALGATSGIFVKSGFSIAGGAMLIEPSGSGCAVVTFVLVAGLSPSFANAPAVRVSDMSMEMSAIRVFMVVICKRLRSCC